MIQEHTSDLVTLSHEWYNLVNLQATATMSTIPFTGALNLSLWKLPYVLPVATAVTPYRWSPDSYATISNSPLADIVYLLRAKKAVQYSVLNAARAFDQLGAPYQQSATPSGIDYGPSEAVTLIPQFALFALNPNGGNVGLTFADVIAAGGPGVGNWDGFGGSAFPVVAQNKIAWWFSADDSIGPNSWSALILNAGLIQGWFGPNPVYEFGQAFWQDVKNNRTLGLFQPGVNADQQITTFDNSGNITSVTNITTGGTGQAWLDAPNWSQPWVLPASVLLPGYGPGWMLSTSTLSGGSALVANGSPLFVISPDFSEYVEIVFGSTDPNVQKNSEGNYGPIWGNSGNPLVTIDTDGNIYYLQLDSSGSFLNVYSTFNPAGIGPVLLNPSGQPSLTLPFCVAKPPCVAGMRFRDLI